jgi:hypothetical protein
MNPRKLILGVGIAAACSTASAHATSLRNYVISSGGLSAPRATNGTHQAVWTLGQSAIGTMTTNGYRMRLGFWSFGRPVLAVGPAETPRQIAFGPAFPNPTRGTVRFVMALPRTATVRLEVLDVSGRRVGEPIERALEEGYHDLTWEAPAGRAGIYFVRAFVGSRLVGQRRVALIE